jgi:hypothetical protein
MALSAAGGQRIFVKRRYGMSQKSSTPARPAYFHHWQRPEGRALARARKTFPIAVDADDAVHSVDSSRRVAWMEAATASRPAATLPNVLRPIGRDGAEAVVGWHPRLRLTCSPEMSLLHNLVHDLRKTALLEVVP